MVKGSFWGLPMRCYYFFCIDEFRFAPFAGIHSFVEDKDLVSLVKSIFLVGFDDEVWHKAVVLKIRPNFFEKKKRKKESHIKSSNDEREWREERPTGSEEWMLNLLDFFLFLFEKMHNSCRRRF